MIMIMEGILIIGIFSQIIEGDMWNALGLWMMFMITLIIGGLTS